MNFPSLALIAYSVVVFASRTASAETVLVEGGGATSTPSFIPTVDHAAPRLRLDATGNLTIGVASSPPYRPGRGYPSSLSGVVGGPGFTVDAGVQVRDLVAIYVRAEASGFGSSGSPFVSMAAGYAVAEWTPFRWISLGTGLGYEILAPSSTCNGMGPCPDGPHWSGLSVPLIMGFNLFESGDPNRVRRTAFRVGLEAAGGVEPSTDAFGWHRALGLGVAWM